MEHRYYFENILAWIVHGIKQFALYWIPVLDPSPEYGSPPGFWLDFYTSSAWYNHIDANYIPDATWISYWMRASWLTLFSWINEVGTGAINLAVDWVRSFTGFLLYGYATFAQWINAIHVRAGSWVPPWTIDLASGLQFLWNRLPYAVRESILTFEQLIDQLLDELWDQVINYYLLFVQRVGYVYDWLVYTGLTIGDWYTSVGDFVRDFVRTPAEHITGWLGAAWTWVLYFWSDPGGYVENLLSPTWTRLVIFARDCLNFWYDLWGAHAQTLADFLAAPLGWLYDRVEDELIDRW